MSRTSIPNRIKSKKAGNVMDVLPSGRGILALEKRIAFDAAGAATAAKTLHAATMFGPDAAHHTGMTTLFGPADAAGRDALSGALGRSGLFEALPAAAQDKSVVFIESDVADIPALIKDIDPSARIVILDATKDGVDAIANYLATHAGLRNVSIFSHGSEGDLNLGTASLDAATMQGRYAADLATIKASLAPDANILVYGCDFAENADGNAAAHLLASLTGANVAASTNLTGGTAEGGDFVLEDQVGTVSAPDILKPTIAADYDGVLASPTTIFANSGTGLYHANLEFLTFANTSLATNGITNGATATYATADGGTVTATFSAVSNAADEATFLPAPFSAYAPSKFYTGYNNTSSTSEQLYGQYSGTSSFTVSFTATDKNGNAYAPNIAFVDSEVTDASGEYYQVTSNGGAFQNAETVGSNSYALTGVGTQTVTLSKTASGVPVLVTTGATSLNITVEIAGGKEGFALALVEPTLTLDANNSSGSTGDNYITTFTEKGAAVAIGDTDTTATEPGITNAASAQIVLTNAQAGDLLSVGALPSGITGSIDTSVAGEVKVNLAGSASLASYDTAIQAIGFSNTSSDPSTVDRTIDVTYNDGNQTSNTAVTTVHVVAVNDPPVETVPGAQATNKDTALAISGLSVSDVDANGGTETTTLSVADGTISLASTNGLTFSQGTGTNDASETFTGTLSAIDNAVATLTYHPSTGYVGSDTLSFATDDDGNTGSGGAKTTTQTVGITVNNVNPADRGTIANQRFTDGQAGVSIATSQAFSDSLGLTLTYSATGLTAGLTLNATTGAITGTVDHDASKNAPSMTGSGATLDGKYTVVETASDGQGGSTTQTFTIDATNQAPAVGAKTANQASPDGATIGAVNAAAAFSDPNGDPLTYAATGLPAGLTISSAGMITGTVAKNAVPGTDTVTVTATDDKGAATSETFSWVIKDVPPTDKGTLANQTVTDGQAGVSIATSQGFTDSLGNALTYAATGLPAGLAINAATGAITGTINHDASKNAPSTTGGGATLDGKYTVVETASDGLGGSTAQSFTIDSTNQAPVVGTVTANQSNSDGDTIAAVNAAAAFSDPNGDPLTYAATGLPAGLTVSATGVISGTVAKNAAPGTDTVTVTATDDKGAVTSETFSWVIKGVPPTASGTLANQAYSDGQTGISIGTAQGFADANGNALTYGASGLPAGLTINATTGAITGTIDHDDSKNAPTTTGSGATLDGTYAVTVTASDGLGGTATQTFSIASTNQAPVVGTATANQASNDGATITPVNAAAAFSDPNGDPLTSAATGLPAGLTISAAGVISGTVAANAQPGTDTVMVTATDDKGAATTETFNWVVKDVPPRTNGTLANQATSDGQAGVSIATSQGFADSLNNTLTYTASGLPAGLAINASTGKISGTVRHDDSKNAPVTTGSGATLDGTYTVIVTASDGLGGTATQSFTIDATNQAPVVGAATANQANNDGDAIAPLNAANAFADPNGDPLTYTASGLPAGLAISSAGVITGTVAGNAQPGTDAITVTATDDKGAATSETFSWVIRDVPPTKNGTLANQTVTDGQAGVSIATSQGFTDSNGNALTYAATGLPAGLAINATTGAITGTIDHDASKNAPTTGGCGATLDGTYTVTVTASDGLGGGTVQSFTIDATNQAPLVGTKTADQSTVQGAMIAPVDASKAFSDPNGDPLTYAASGLPAGLSISSVGLITGTVATNAPPGTNPVSVTATDDKGAATTESFNWMVKEVPPTTSGTLANQATTDGQTGIAIATARGFADSAGNALTYAAGGLPAGLAINATTGQITGTIDHDASKNAPVTSGSGATLDGTYTVTVTATDGFGGTAAQGFTIDSTNQAPVVGTATANQTSKDGQAIASVATAGVFADPNTGDVLAYSASDLPAGLAIDPTTGVIGGTVAPNAAPGSYAVRVLATDDKGAASREAFTWTIQEVPPTAASTIANQTFADSAGGISIATAGAFTSPNGLALTYRATGLPSGLSIDPGTGAITGRLDHDASKEAPVTSGSGATLDGTYTIVVTAGDGQGGTAQQTFTIDATDSAPVVGTATADQNSSDGAKTSVDASAAFADPNTGDVLTYSASGLPTGLGINASTGLISGTIDKAASLTGPTLVTVTATDDKGAATSETFHWSVADVPPIATPALPDQAAYDGARVSTPTANGFTNPNGLPLTYSATGLPSGLAIDPTTGLISGTLDHDASVLATGGVYTIAVTANDGQGGSATNTFHLTATNQAPVVGTPTANQTSPDGQAITPVAAGAAFSDPNGDRLTYAASGLPSGLSLDPTSGRITGTVAPNATPGTTTVTVTATDDKGAAARETFAWTVDDVAPTSAATLPNQTYADATAGIGIATAGAFTSPNGLPLTYGASGLPAGLTIDATTGAITGQLDHDASKAAPATSGSGATLEGTYAVAVTASDGQGGTDTQTFTIEATNTAPALVKPTADQHGADGATTSVDAAAAFADPNTGDVLTYAASGLPAGLGIDPATGLISGTIDKGASLIGPYTATVTATDDKGAATSETFRWQVDDVAPAATPPLADQAVDDGATLSLTTANGFTNPNGLPFTYSATGLPSGLAIDPATGIISGTLDHDASKMAANGSYTVAVTVGDGQGGTATNTFHMTASNQAPVVGTPTASQTSSDGQGVAAVDASRAFADPNGDPLTYAVSGLPTGLSIDPSTGRITGTVAANAQPGVYAVTVVAIDDKGAARPETFTWGVDDTPPVAAGSIANVSAPDGQAGLAIATASAFNNPDGSPLTYTATGLPAGLAINSQTGQITGTLDHDASADAPLEHGAGATLEGTYTIAVTAADGRGGTATQTFTFDTINSAPVVGNVTADQTGTAGNIASLDAAIAFSDPNSGDLLTYAASGLPAGLTIDPNSGMISGTIATTADSPTPYAVTVTATDDKGAAASERFAWTINPVPPSAAAPIPNLATTDGSTVSVDTSSHFSDPDGVPLVYTASGLPSDLAIDAASGIISGTLDHDASEQGQTTGAGATLDGSYAVSVTATGGGAPATQTFTIDSANQAPVVTARTADQTGTTGQTIATLDASRAFSDPNGDPLTYTASGLPSGLTIATDTGAITGTIAATAPGAYAVTVTATDDKGAATNETFAYTVADAAPRATGAIAGQTDADSTAGIGVATGGAFASPNDLPLTYTASGLPQGLTIDAASGLISGTLDHDASAHAPREAGAGATLDGTYTVVVTANDGQGGIASQTFTIDATNGAPVVGVATPDQRSFDGNAASIDASAAFGDPNTGDGLSYAASGLPIGLTINAATGLISGTIDKDASANGPYAVKVTATDDKGAATSETFAWTVDDIVPVATPPLSNRSSHDRATVTLATANGFTNPNDLPLTYTASGLPNGLAIDPNTGVIAGTLDPTASTEIVNGVYTLAVTVTASDGEGGSATNIFHLTVTNQAPVVAAKTADQLSSDGQTINAVDASKAFVDPNGDTLAYAASDLPAGLTIDPSTGLITGTVSTAATPGSHLVTVTADDGKGGATAETFDWAVNDTALPKNGTIAGATFADSTGDIAIPTSSTFVARSGDTLTYGATGLPAGLAIDPSTGLITGQLDHDASKDAPATSGQGAKLEGTYTVVVSASNGEGGTATQTFTLDATNTAPTLVKPTVNQEAADGAATSLDTAPAFADANTGDALTYAASGLPTGLTIDPATGLISGTIDRSASVKGPYAVTVTATDDKGAATSERFTWRIDNVAPVATPPLADQAAYDGATLSLATANGFTNPNDLPLTYAATGLPTGLSIDAATGVISGTLDHDASILAADGVYTIAVTAGDGQGGSATNTFHLTATNQAPVVDVPTSAQIADDGQTVAPVDTSRAFTDPNGDPLTYAASNLPAGLSIDPGTGLVTGTIASGVAPGNTIVNVSATDDKGAAALETFTWSIDDVPPSVVGTLAAQRFADSANNVSIATASGFASPDGLPLTFSATGLPKGLTIDPATGVISGFVNHDASKNAPVTTGSGATLDGTYKVTVTADDGEGGLARQVFTIDSTNQAPALGARTLDQSGLDGATVSLAAGNAFADPNIGDGITFTATGLPKGLSIDAATGAITGTIDRSASLTGPTIVTVTATDDKGAATSETFAWSVTDAPPTVARAIAPTILADGSAASIATASGFDSPAGLPLAFGAAGLPAGLSIDGSTGIIAGTLDHDASKNAPVTAGSGATLDGTYTVVVTASDNQGGVASQSFTIDARNAAPAIAAAVPDQRSTDGASVALAIAPAFADPNGDPVTFTASGLPKGLAIDPVSGVISGTIDPRASATGPTTVIVTATDDKGAATSATFAWSVADAPPTAGPPVVLAAVPDGTTIPPFDTAGDFTSPNGLPLTYAATGLPAGLAIDPATGIVTGSLDHDASANAPVVSGAGATQRGTYAVVVTASDGQGGTAAQTFVLGTSNQGPAVGTRTPDQRSSDGDAVSLDAARAFADPNGDPLTFAASGLPKGLAIDPATGTITGRNDPRASVYGPFAVTVTATDDKDASASETFVWRVADAAVTAGAPLATLSLPDGSPIVPIDAAAGFSDPNGLPLTYGATGLPAGLSIDPATGAITGRLAHDASLEAPVTSGSGATLQGSYQVVVTASDGQGGSATQGFAVVAGNRAPIQVGTIADQTGRAGQAIPPLATAPDFADPNGDPLVFLANGLPPGLAIDPTTGLVSGTIATTGAAAYPVTVTATDDKGASVSESFVFRVAPTQPVSQPVTQPPVLPLASLVTADAFIPLATALGDTVVNAALVADTIPPTMRETDIAATTPVLDVINLTSGDQEQSVVISTNDIVISTVNNVRPLDGLQDLATPGAGIVRSGAATNERGDRFDRAKPGFGTILESIDAPADTLGASRVDSSVSTIGDGTAINVETVLRDRVLTVTLDNRSAIACVVPVAGYAVTRADGSPLPGWLRLEGKGVIIGKVPDGVDAIDLRITSTLRNGTVHERTVRILTDTGAIRPQPAQPPLHRAGLSLSDMVAALRQAPAAGPAPGRGLSRFLD